MNPRLRTFLTDEEIEAATAQPAEPGEYTMDVPWISPSVTGQMGALVGILALIISAVLIAKAVNHKKAVLLFVVIALWAVLPPLYFWFEYYYIYRPYGRDGTFELYKHGQQISAAIWAGVLASLLVFASSERVKRWQERENQQEAAATETASAE